MYILLTGHNEFPNGMFKALEMIAGKQEDFKVIPFLEPEKLAQDIDDFFSTISENDQVICFTDLVGGTPYRTCVEKTVGKNNIAVIGGTNLGMLLEASAMRTISESAKALAEQVVAAGKSAIGYFEIQESNENIEEDGI